MTGEQAEETCGQNQQTVREQHRLKKQTELMRGRGADGETMGTGQC